MSFDHDEPRTAIPRPTRWLWRRLAGLDAELPLDPLSPATRRSTVEQRGTAIEAITEAQRARLAARIEKLFGLRFHDEQPTNKTNDFRTP